MPAALSFTYPFVLLSLLALPVLWFLLRAVPQSPQRQRFGGLFFLQHLKDKDETPSRMPWPLLLLRLAMLALVIIACAGPILNAPEKNNNDAPILIVLDDTWLAANKWSLRQSTLQKLALAAQNNDRRIWILTTSAKQPALMDSALTGPMTAIDLAAFADISIPSPFAANRTAILPLLKQLKERLSAPAEIHWLADGYFTSDNIRERQFARELASLGTIISYAPDAPVLYLNPVRYRAEALAASVRTTSSASADQQFGISVVSRDGRVLDQLDVTLPAGEIEASVDIDLPLALRNTIGSVRLNNVRSAGAVQLTDASARRALVGLADAGDALAGTLLDGRFYLRQALAPYALFQTGPVNQLANSEASVIILDDFGRVRTAERTALEDWVEAGGILIRFAGPALADAAQDSDFNDGETLLPVPLRGGGRAFGGALTWEEPQPLGDFAADSPFGGLIADPEIVVRRQILARPGPITSTNSWAWLADGTPLVTAQAKGDGLLVLFHVTASPSWSDLPVSGLFVEMLRRLASLSVTAADNRDPNTTYAPKRLLNGFGQLTAPTDTAAPVKANAKSSPVSPPGLYGSPDAPLAINAVSDDTSITPLDAIGAFDGTSVRTYATDKPQSLIKLLMVIAFGLFLLESLLTLFVQGKLRLPVKRRAAAIGLVLVGSGLFVAPPDSHAQSQSTGERMVLDPKAVDAALAVRFAYVLTGDKDIDALSKAGLSSLSLRLDQRTALEPASPTGIDLTRDTLSVYPLLYWPITDLTPLPPEPVLQKLEAYMAGGGMIVFDTRDGERQIANRQTPEGAALKRILEQLNIPPLEPLPPVHVLRRSFYLMDDLPGRNQRGPVWVEAGIATGNLNDGVTPVIISGRDWAAAGQQMRMGVFCARWGLAAIRPVKWPIVPGSISPWSPSPVIINLTNYKRRPFLTALARKRVLHERSHLFAIV